MEAPPLIELIRRRSGELKPLPTGLDPVLESRKPIQGVVFDIYGTLMISGSGDISLARSENRSPALREALLEAGYHYDDPDRDLASILLQMIDLHRQRRKADGIEFPEVRIEEVWEEWLTRAREEGGLRGEGSLEQAIVAYECRVNPCWPMPGLVELLDHLSARGLPMGIVSNAQFYTPLLFPALAGRDLPSLGFADDLCIWSYREREGKPSTALYQRLTSALRAKDLQPERILYIGNDLLNDVLPAHREGFQTVLFAGDQRSLRLRREDARCRGISPGAVITHLHQVKALI